MSLIKSLIQRLNVTDCNYAKGVRTITLAHITRSWKSAPAPCGAAWANFRASWRMKARPTASWPRHWLSTRHATPNWAATRQPAPAVSLRHHRLQARGGVSIRWPVSQRRGQVHHLFHRHPRLYRSQLYRHVPDSLGLAPRIQSFQGQQLYALAGMAVPDLRAYAMAPVKRLNRALIEGQWDMLLRLVMSLKQKDVTAFTVLDIIMGQ
jgi:hypothetical protein